MIKLDRIKNHNSYMINKNKKYYVEDTKGEFNSFTVHGSDLMIWGRLESIFSTNAAISDYTIYEIETEEEWNRLRVLEQLVK